MPVRLAVFELAYVSVALVADFAMSVLLVISPLACVGLANWPSPFAEAVTLVFMVDLAVVGAAVFKLFGNHILIIHLFFHHFAEYGLLGVRFDKTRKKRHFLQTAQ